MHVTAEQLLWFILVGVLWAGYFFLEGFDFGVGILLPFIGRNDPERRALINCIGPIWDGNEVWVIVAIGATFAAFPLWYSEMLSNLYLLFFTVIVALILRGVAFEWRGKRDSARWRRNFDLAIFIGSALPAFLWGLLFGDLIKGVPLTASGTVVGGISGIVTPYALLTGLTTLAVFTLHGSVFLSLKVGGYLRGRVNAYVRRIAPVTALVLFVYLSITYLIARSDGHSGDVPGMIPVAALVLIVAVTWLSRERLFGWAFVATGAAILALTATVFMTLYPDTIMSSIRPALSLSITRAASQPYTLNVMTIVAAIFTPLVLVYQAWTYWIFRKRIEVPRNTNSEPEQVR